MAALSELVQLFKQRQRGAAQGNVTFGAGSSGARTFQGRDSEAGSKKEQQIMQSPVFKAFVSQFKPSTPFTDFLASRGRT